MGVKDWIHQSPPLQFSPVKGGEGLGRIRVLVVLRECAGHWTIGQTVAAAGAFMLKHFEHMMDVLHFRMDRALGTGFAAKAAGDAERFYDSNFHAAALPQAVPPKARLGSGAQGLRRKSNTSAMGF